MESGTWFEPLIGWFPYRLVRWELIIPAQSAIPKVLPAASEKVSFSGRRTQGVVFVNRQSTAGMDL